MTKTETFTKAIKFDLLELTDTKKDVIGILAEDYARIYNFVAPLLPGMRKDGNAPNNMGMYDKVFKQKMNGESIIHSQSVLYAIQDATSNFKTMDVQNVKVQKSIQSMLKRIDNNDAFCTEKKFSETKTKKLLLRNQRKLTKLYKRLNTSYPVMEKLTVKFGKPAWKFVEHNNKQYIEIPTFKKGSRYQKMLLPIKESEYYNELIKTVPKWGTCQVFPDRDVAILTVTYPRSKSVPKFDDIPDFYAGIDIGVNNLAVLSIIDAKTDKVVFTKLWSGKEAMYVRKRFHNHRKKMQNIKRYDIVKRGKGHEMKYMENVNHNISREIVEITNKYNNCKIIMENLSGFTRKVRIQWNRYQLQEMITYKALAYGMKTYSVDPKYTSQQCSKCGVIDEKSRSGINFECTNCGFQLNADVNAAKNLASKGKYIITKGKENRDNKSP
jgi:putative transposase